MVTMGGPAPIFSPGEIVSARYRISAYLGQGAAGEVYGAEDLHLRSRVALKVLRPGASRDPQSRHAATDQEELTPGCAFVRALLRR